MRKRAVADLAAVPALTEPIVTGERWQEPANLRPVVGSDRDYFVEKDGMRFAGIHLLVHRDHETGERDYVEHIVVKDPFKAGKVSGLQEFKVHARHFSRRHVVLPLEFENVLL